MFKKNFKIIAKTFLGLEDILKKEIEDLGATKVNKLNRAVEFEGDLELLYTANLKLRTALSVLVPIANFKAKDNQMLYDNIFDIAWERYFNLHQTFAVYAVIHSSFFSHSGFVALKSKDAIADHFRDKYGERPDVDPKFADIKIVVHIQEDKVSISIDTSGKALFQRGYKTEITQAPINEVLAAGIIQLSGWKKDKAFIDPMCGSGTFLIEAAMIAANFPANLLRQRFGFQNLRGYDKDLWKEIVDKAALEINKDIVPIIGNDIDEDAIIVAQNNINNAGFGKQIQLKTGNFTDLENNLEEGIIITNPPYDQRLKESDITTLYKSLGDTFKTNFKGFDCWVFSANIKALKNLGLKARKKTKLMNGSLDAELHLFEIYEGSKKNKSK